MLCVYMCVCACVCICSFFFFVRFRTVNFKQTCITLKCPIGTHKTEKPMAPGTLRVSNLSTTSACIEWTKPLDDGGSPITSYRLEKRTAGQRTWQKLVLLPPDALDCELENMNAAKDYYVRIKAENKYGCGPAKELLEPIRVKGIQKGIMMKHVTVYGRMVQLRSGDGTTVHLKAGFCNTLLLYIHAK